MFMVTNCKIRAMKKFITSIFIAAAALSACNKINEPVAEVSDKVSFNIEAAMPQTRTALVENNGTYSAMWKAGDTYSIVEVGDGANKQNGTNGNPPHRSVSGKKQFDQNTQQCKGAEMGALAHPKLRNSQTEDVDHTIT